jgi:hypothetical protein
MSWNLLERFIESEHFNRDPSLTVAYLARYADHVGIQYVLCSKLRQFSYEDIEFFLPQLCHLVMSLDNESMALEEFILDLCEESVNGALLVRRSFLAELTFTHASFRPSGSYKRTSETSPKLPPRTHSRHAAASTTEFNASCLVHPSPSGEKRLPRMSCQSHCCRVSYSVP